MFTAEIYKEPEKLLQALIGFDTTTGKELGMCMFIKELLDGAGIKTRLFSLDENRPNLWAEIRSKNPKKQPLLLYGHLDVVPAEPDAWNTPPFTGVIEDGYIYGRGAADMKSALVMFICLLLKIKFENIETDCDIFFLALSDEEDTGKYGAAFMVENHEELFENIRYAIGEMGGFSLDMYGKRFYPVTVAEKQCGELKMTFRGKSGHGSLKHYNTAMEKMARAVAALSSCRLKTRVTPEAAFMISELAGAIGGLKGFLLKLLKNPLLTNSVLDILKSDGALFDNLLHNSVNVTVINGGTAVNVVPDSVSISADLRVLPATPLETAIADIREVLREKAGLADADYEIEVVVFDKNEFKPDLRHFNALKQTLLAADPEGIPFPFVLGAVTDGRILSRAGIMTYGFIPMRLPAGFDFLAQAHAANERIPLAALPFGIDALLAFITKHYSSEC